MKGKSQMGFTSERLCPRAARSKDNMSLVIVLICTLIGISAQAQGRTPVNPDGAIGGLKASFTNVKGVRTRYYEMGQGEPLLLLHGGGLNGRSSANVWSKNIPGLAKSFHVFAIDRLGSGLTDNPREDKDYNIPGEIEFLRDFLETMKIRRVNLIGHSAGGALAFYFSIAHPEMVRTLIIVSPGGEIPGGGPQKEEAFFVNCPKEPATAAWKCRIRAQTLKPDVAFDNDDYWQSGYFMMEQPKAKVTAAKLKAGAGEPLRTEQAAAWRKSMLDRVAKEGVLQMPVLLYWGRQDPTDWAINDPVSKMQQGLALLDAIGAKDPSVQMIVLNDAGHYMYREYPDLFNADVIHFIDFWNRHAAKTLGDSPAASR
jgi:2-hydroxy-6-oxonona-2,4-dienedioate hydrolase